ncbi:hypothetical protein N9X46_02720 [Paracoccaceae bacterium]|nr:hypothetical protein [Paracoccaceae bacterium]MDB3948329.1 hypothetical protein [Paracoccaceae bacterium]
MSISKIGVVLMICLGLVGFIGYHQQGARSWTETNETGEYRVCQKSSDAAQMICDAWHPKQLIDLDP